MISKKNRIDFRRNKETQSQKIRLYECNNSKKTEIFASETKNSRTVVYLSETVHKVREFEVATKILLFFYTNVASFNY